MVTGILNQFREFNLKGIDFDKIINKKFRIRPGGWFGEDVQQRIHTQYLIELTRNQ